LTSSILNSTGLTEVNSPVYARVPIFLLSTLPRNNDVAIARPDFDNKSRSIASRVSLPCIVIQKRSSIICQQTGELRTRVYTMSIKSLSLDDGVSSGILFEQTEWITPCIYFLPALLIAFCRGISARGNVQLPLFEFSYFMLDRSVNVGSRLAPNFFDEYCYRNWSERRDRIEPFSFKV